MLSNGDVQHSFVILVVLCVSVEFRIEAGSCHFLVKLDHVTEKSRKTGCENFILKCLWTKAK